MNDNSIIMGSFTITGAKVFEIQHQCSGGTGAAYGFGVGGSLWAGVFAVSTIFTQVMITKIS
jgi:hypothetical protein